MESARHFAQDEFQALAAADNRIQSLGISFSSTSERLGATVGFSSDRLVRFQDANRQPVVLSKWATELPTTYRWLYANVAGRPVPKCATAHYNEGTFAGFGLNRSVSTVHLGLGYSASKWGVGYPNDPPVSFAVLRSAPGLQLLPGSATTISTESLQ